MVGEKSGAFLTLGTEQRTANSWSKNVVVHQSRAKTALHVVPTAKQNLLNSLDDSQGFNSATKERTKLVEELTKTNPTPKPGSKEGFARFAIGTWKIVYAPHISTMRSLAGGSFDPVIYIMHPGGLMTSHARFSFPLIGSGWLSVSGTYGSNDDDRVCRVDFDKAWLSIDSHDTNSESAPIATFDDVPESISKIIIQTLGQIGFVKSVSVFPVSYLDHDTIVFDFELLGTRICARKVASMEHKTFL
ncbi:hypothetical protein IV203_005850 [Nitzschia inconspicua]|uniref:Uncharacterized protein n=1 Tax=Nitzschia inconspicua TaxID=303405 RepID=A0A9K3PHB0_9STRA|nr:hypothetical protein IV203_005850 [Nitzschia inconspicua]